MFEQLKYFVVIFSKKSRDTTYKISSDKLFVLNIVVNISTIGKNTSKVIVFFHLKVEPCFEC